MPNLDPDWRRLLARAWSARLIAVSLVLTVAEIAVPLVLPGLVPPLTFAALAGGTQIAALVARVLVQQDLRK